MRVLLSGTSNAIITNGISAALAKDERVSAFHNASYGASGTVAIGDHLREIDFSQWDVCVLDYCVNEEVLLWMGTTQLNDALSNVYNMVDAASRAGCLPVITVFASDTRLAVARPLEESLHRVLGAAGVPVFNLYDYMAALRERHGFAPGDLFLDPNHVHRVLSHFVGTEILTWLEGLDRGALSLREIGEVFQPLRFVPFSGLSVAGDAREVEQSTRIMSRKLLNVAPGARITHAPGAPAELAGMTYNAARSWGALADGATGEEVARIAYEKLFRLQRGLTLVSWPLGRPIRSDGEAMTLDYSCEPPGGDDRPEPGLELLGLILRDLGTPRPLAVLGTEGEGARIDRIVAPAREAAMVEALRKVIAGL